MSPVRQTTLATRCEASGHGLHSAEPVEIALLPADPDTGIRFRRTDLAGAPEISARAGQIRSVEWETSLRAGSVEVRTVEHVLAALHGSGIDNAIIEIDGPEPPALDGSAREWCGMIEAAGVCEQGADARILRLDRPLTLVSGESVYAMLPDTGFRVSTSIEFEHPAIGRQFVSARVDRSTFREELGGARTFGLAEWEGPLRERGLALGATPENTIVVGEDGVERGCELRYPDEFVRHKALDIVGDLALVGARLECHIVAERPGHRGNVAVAKKLSRELNGDGPAFDIQKILEYMPHRYPMLLVDRILEFEERERIVGLKNVTINEPFFAGHFPGHPIMPGVLVVEALAQCGGLLLMNEYDDPADKVVYFMSLDGVKFRRPVTPGDQLVFEVEMLQLRTKACRMRGVARVEGKVVAEATMMASVVDK
ncbi:MAG: UDP-3-O-acyl-N-acetylglucosamine deacetylase [Gemmatimonadota bacterium]|nr:UDP-3-O-acyl-N-acetylglucosamine deacetylase [Gemmatimonadota bacterium]